MFRMGEEEKAAVGRVIDSGQLFKINDGLREVEHFEKEIEEKFSVSRAILMTSGKGALISALVAMGVGPGDEVIVPAYTYIATAIAVVAAGAMPVIAEVDESLTLDPRDFERKITSRTKAAIPVHMMGYPCKMDEIVEIADRHGISVLEDACQADGGTYRGKRLGTIGRAGALSFNDFKIISAGEGGCLLTDDEKLFRRALVYHDSSAVAYFGNQTEGFDEELFCGSEFRANEISAAILRVQLTRLDGIISDLRRVKSKLTAALGGKFDIMRANDEGECALALTLKFDDPETPKQMIAKGAPLSIPVYLGKHVYYDWGPIMRRRGAFHPLMDPFAFPANDPPEYSKDMCKKSFDILARSAHVALHPDWSDEQIERLAEKLVAAKG